VIPRSNIEDYRIEGHAIVSGDARIADANGVTPPSLHNDVDWKRFQRALDEAVVTVLGRRGHEAHPNPKRRNRLVLSSSARGVERRPDAWWWNPDDIPLAGALGQAAPAGGIVAVPGGQTVFDFFLAAGFDAFHLACKASVRIPDGVTLFSAIAKGATAEALLTDHGLVAGPPETLDAKAGVTLTTWRRATS
jgi:hypothetical protein